MVIWCTVQVDKTELVARVSELEDLLLTKEEETHMLECQIQKLTAQFDSSEQALQATQNELTTCARELEGHITFSKLCKLEDQDDFSRSKKLWNHERAELERSVDSAERRLVEAEGDLRIEQVHRARAEQRLQAKSAEVADLAAEAYQHKAELNLANAREAEHMVQKEDLEHLCADAHRGKRQAEHALLVSRNKFNQPTAPYTTHLKNDDNKTPH